MTKSFVKLDKQKSGTDPLTIWELGTHFIVSFSKPDNIALVCYFCPVSFPHYCEH